MTPGKPISSAPRIRLLIADGDREVSRFLTSHFTKRNFETSVAENGDQALRVFRSFSPRLVLMDMSLSGMPALEVLSRMKQLRPDAAVLVASEQGDPKAIFRASQLGADEYLSKPLIPGDLDAHIDRLLERSLPQQPATQYEKGGRKTPDFSMLFGTSPKMEEVKMTVEQVAETNATVLVRGESGTGKEVVARMIYTNSLRREKPFVKVNCAAIPHELLESELFGYEPGAFTGANRQKLGKFDQANYGTIFLDEISEMHPALQAKLLHVLQDGEFARLGGKRDIAVDVRVLAATNKPLERAVEDGTFREDLFYRLNVVTVHIPPLRERREEIPVFLEFFLQKYSEYYAKHPAAFSEYAVSRMMEYAWPGNIRELENLVKRYVIVGNEPQIIRELSTHKPIVTSISPERISEKQEGGSSSPRTSEIDKEMPSLLEIGRRAATQAEQEAIERILVQTRWNRRQAAKILKISYKALLNKIKAMETRTQSAAAAPK